MAVAMTFRFFVGLAMVCNVVANDPRNLAFAKTTESPASKPAAAVATSIQATTSQSPTTVPRNFFRLNLNMKVTRTKTNAFVDWAAIPDILAKAVASAYDIAFNLVSVSAIQIPEFSGRRLAGEATLSVPVDISNAGGTMNAAKAASGVGAVQTKFNKGLADKKIPLTASNMVVSGTGATQAPVAGTTTPGVTVTTTPGVTVTTPAARYAAEQVSDRSFIQSFPISIGLLSLLLASAAVAMVVRVAHAYRTHANSSGSRSLVAMSNEDAELGGFSQSEVESNPLE